MVLSSLFVRDDFFGALKWLLVGLDTTSWTLISSTLLCNCLHFLWGWAISARDWSAIWTFTVCSISTLDWSLLPLPGLCLALALRLTLQLSFRLISVCVSLLRLPLGSIPRLGLRLIFSSPTGLSLLSFISLSALSHLYIFILAFALTPPCLLLVTRRFQITSWIYHTWPHFGLLFITVLVGAFFNHSQILILNKINSFLIAIGLPRHHLSASIHVSIHVWLVVILLQRILHVQLIIYGSKAPILLSRWSATVHLNCFLLCPYLEWHLLLTQASHRCLGEFVLQPDADPLVLPWVLWGSDVGDQLVECVLIASVSADAVGSVDDSIALVLRISNRTIKITKKSSLSKRCVIQIKWSKLWVWLVPICSIHLQRSLMEGG